MPAKRAALQGKGMRVGIRIAFGRLMQALKVLLDQQLRAGLRPALDTHLVAPGPIRYEVRGNGHLNDAATEVGRDCGDIARAFQRIEQRTPRRKFDGRFDSPAVAQLDDFLLSYTQP